MLSEHCNNYWPVWLSLYKRRWNKKIGSIAAWYVIILYYNLKELDSFELCSSSFSQEAEQEMQLNIADREVFAFPKEEEIEKPLDVVETEQRIKDVLMVLSNFKKFREEGRWAYLPVSEPMHRLHTYMHVCMSPFEARENLIWQISFFPRIHLCLLITRMLSGRDKNIWSFWKPICARTSVTIGFWLTDWWICSP